MTKAGIVNEKQQEIINQFKIDNEKSFEINKYKIKIDVIIATLMDSINANDEDFTITEGLYSQPTNSKLKELYKSLKLAR